MRQGGGGVGGGELRMGETSVYTNREMHVFIAARQQFSHPTEPMLENVRENCLSTCDTTDLLSNTSGVDDKKNPSRGPR
jgi:hypothetical protein